MFQFLARQGYEKIAIIQARMSSTRLPNKVLPILNEADNSPIRKDSRSEKLDGIILATSNSKSDDPLADAILKRGFQVFRGNLDDVLKRYYDCSILHSADVILRITGDCPLIDPKLIDEMIDAFDQGGWDYLSNASNDGLQLSVPDGFDIEIFNIHALSKAHHNALLKSEREHVTPWMLRKESNLKWGFHQHTTKYPYYRLTVDEPKDFEVMKDIFKELCKNTNDVAIDQIIEFLQQNEHIAIKNLSIVPNEGYLKSLAMDKSNDSRAKTDEAQKMWARAKKVIPGGNMLLSKRPEMFLPGKWPTYFSKAKGCKVWDLENNEYLDMSIMGIGTNTLGYGHPEVDSAVLATVASGNMSSLNCPEEVYLAEKLSKMHSWSEKVRFARSGGEANAIAIRIARAFTGKDKVAICGYHGWHDWYLATNLESKTNLESHLLPGLEPNGVPRSLTGSVIPFEYNDFDGLQKIVENHDLAAIKMEVERSGPPVGGFLEKVRRLCDQKNIILIFDECTSGFRETFGGLHLKYNVDPDMAMFGKALGNGYAITAVLGRADVMDAAQTTFISSTFWTERIGPTAAIKTLEIMEREKSYEQITSIGRNIKDRWRICAEKHELDINIFGLDALACFSFNSANSLKYKTLISQELLKSGILAGTSVYVCTAHSTDVIEYYFEKLDSVFSLISDCENGELPIEKALTSEVCHSSFKRLN